MALPGIAKHPLGERSDPEGLQSRHGIWAWPSGDESVLHRPSGAGRSPEMLLRAIPGPSTSLRARDAPAQSPSASLRTGAAWAGNLLSGEIATAPRRGNWKASPHGWARGLAMTGGRG